ncbi:MULTISPECIES: hypothetical protein [Saccharopolyspora]|uniref:Vitamin K epoxide reductase domain-containing protein n=1 Tax=Saccharopolyspora gregorii TaxID=33914 RepID=A0ABP6RWU7_9PSEU|nr:MULTISPECIES: hypothetical protein [Saccharopolyspora]MCA1186946.1 hypothetical protein [Saccharopolyspora sp. 6T]MCA1192675.1 hypothetical protein [Saccharopolyspora sp. 6V]MCA1228764.1 hypothetical protein [Saccharopolyspora sp. 6M]MCA1280493.1 hypothetical protein [Saccharopolyspora sp. 7B]
MTGARPATALLTPLVAFGGAVLGVLVLFFAQRALSPYLAGGPGAVCTAPDCVLGVGLWLLLGGFLAVCLAFVAGTAVALAKGAAPGAVRRGLLVAACCVLAYLVESIVLWVLF